MMIAFVGLLLFGGILVALLIGGGGAFLMKRGGNGGPSRGEQEATARQALDRRLARGEIDQEQYERIRRQIES